MGSWSEFMRGMDWIGLLMFLFSAAAALLCITIHELSHGFAACKLGDTTAKEQGRLTLNPIRHIDLIGLLMMLTVRVGWAKPVPVNMRNFKHPKRDMALTALAGPLSNFVLAFLVLLIGRAVYAWGIRSTAGAYALLALMYIAVLSAGLGVFNLFPIPPLDGSKIALSFLPGRVCGAILHYERYIGLAMLALLWMGVFDRPLSLLREALMQGLCLLSGFPFELLAYYFF